MSSASWIMRGCMFCFSLRKSRAFSAFKSTLQLTSFVLRTHSTANPLLGFLPRSWSSNFVPTALPLSSIRYPACSRTEIRLLDYAGISRLALHFKNSVFCVQVAYLTYGVPLRSSLPQIRPRGLSVLHCY